MNLFSSEEIDCTYKIKSILYHSSIGDNGEVVENEVVYGEYLGSELFN
jgi:hypothetical protein